MVPQTLFPTPEASALMSGTSASLLAAAASSASNLQAEAARHFLHQLSSSHALNPPSQVDLRESSINNSDLGVWAVETIPQGTRFGPFMGKWTMEPSNPKFAWEVSFFLFVFIKALERFMTRLGITMQPLIHDFFLKSLIFLLIFLNGSLIFLHQISLQNKTKSVISCK